MTLLASMIKILVSSFFPFNSRTVHMRDMHGPNQPEHSWSGSSLLDKTTLKSWVDIPCDRTYRNPPQKYGHSFEWTGSYTILCPLQWYKVCPIFLECTQFFQMEWVKKQNVSISRKSDSSPEMECQQKYQDRLQRYSEIKWFNNHNQWKKHNISMDLNDLTHPFTLCFWSVCWRWTFCCWSAQQHLPADFFKWDFHGLYIGFSPKKTGYIKEQPILMVSHGLSSFSIPVAIRGDTTRPDTHTHTSMSRDRALLSPLISHHLHQNCHNLGISMGGDTLFLIFLE